MELLLKFLRLLLKFFLNHFYVFHKTFSQWYGILWYVKHSIYAFDNHNFISMVFQIENSIKLLWKIFLTLSIYFEKKNERLFRTWIRYFLLLFQPILEYHGSKVVLSRPSPCFLLTTLSEFKRNNQLHFPSTTNDFLEKYKLINLLKFA